jgi:hypothetical protein
MPMPRGIGILPMIQKFQDMVSIPERHLSYASMRATSSILQANPPWMA